MIRFPFPVIGFGPPIVRNVPYGTTETSPSQKFISNLVLRRVSRLRAVLSIIYSYAAFSQAMFLE